MQQKKTVSVVIPSWNNESQLKQNLPHVFAAAKVVGAEIIIVDDHSTSDQSLQYLSSLGDKIKLHKHTANLGFSDAVNKGVSLATGDIIMLINTDVRPSLDCFQKALKYFDDDSVYALNFNSQEAWMGGEWRGGLFHHFRAKQSKLNKDKHFLSLWASGGQGAFSRSKWDILGGMDLLYRPFYWEDVDMGYNAWKRGWQILFAPDCQVVHDHVSSVIASNYSKSYIMSTAQRNQFLFIWKNISDFKLILSHLLMLPYYFIKYPLALLHALKYLPVVLKKRQVAKKHWVKSDRDILNLWTR